MCQPLTCLFSPIISGLADEIFLKVQSKPIVLIIVMIINTMTLLLNHWHVVSGFKYCPQYDIAMLVLASRYSIFT